MAESEGARTQVERWLRDSSAALELRVAAAFGKRVGARQVSHATLYLDTDRSETVRETDVVATAFGDDLAITAIVECKATKDFPWVVYTADRLSEAGADSFRDSLVRRGTDASVKASEYDALGHQLIYPLDFRIGYHVAVTSPKDDRNMAWDAVRQVVDAVHGLSDVRHSPLLKGKRRADHWFVPIVVTTSPLFTVYLDAQTGAPTAEEVHWVPLLAQVPVKPWHPISATTATMGTAGVWIADESRVDDVAAQIAANAQTLRRRSSTQPE